MVGHGGSSAGSYLADPTSPIPSHCAVIILFKSASIVVTSTLRVKRFCQHEPFSGKSLNSLYPGTTSSLKIAQCVRILELASVEG